MKLSEYAGGWFIFDDQVFLKLKLKSSKVRCFDIDGESVTIDENELIEPFQYLGAQLFASSLEEDKEDEGFHLSIARGTVITKIDLAQAHIKSMRHAVQNKQHIIHFIPEPDVSLEDSVRIKIFELGIEQKGWKVDHAKTRLVEELPGYKTALIWSRRLVN